MIYFYLLALTATVGLASPPKSAIQRPCYPGDLACVRDNLKANSRCNASVRGSIPSAYNVPYYRFETPYFKSSYVEKNLIIRNHNRCELIDFFFNTATDKAVIAVDCVDMNFESDRTLLQHESYKEDRVYNYHINGTYPILRLTTTIDNANDIDFCKEFTYTEVPILPVFHIDPKDKPTQNFLTRELSELIIYETETFAYRGQEIMSLFVQSLICDFGCKIY